MTHPWHELAPPHDPTRTTGTHPLHGGNLAPAAWRMRISSDQMLSFKSIAKFNHFFISLSIFPWVALQGATAFMELLLDIYVYIFKKYTHKVVSLQDILVPWRVSSLLGWAGSWAKCIQMQDMQIYSSTQHLWETLINHQWTSMDVSASKDRWTTHPVFASLLSHIVQIQKSIDFQTSQQVSLLWHWYTCKSSKKHLIFILARTGQANLPQIWWRLRRCFPIPEKAVEEI